MNGYLFKNLETERKYCENGYLILPPISFKAVEKLCDLYYAFCSEIVHEDGQIYYSMFHNPVHINVQISNEIQNILKIELQEHFRDIRFFAGMFLVKNTGKSILNLHQDWSYVYESKTPITTLWIPLQETLSCNGAMIVAQSTHLLINNIRSGSFPSCRIGPNDYIISRLQTVELAIGQPLAFHPALLHGSHANYKKAPRVVAAILIMPENVNPMYFHKLDDKTAGSFLLDEESFFREIYWLSKGENPRNLIQLHSINYTHVVPTVEQISKYLS
ncbi:MAG: phytanoyl-CoA dioxygenase family protein [Chitinophagales bacterium]|nr:phytanoyl-CoA dioxygenase family protein [Chitinophagales bacterium]